MRGLLLQMPIRSDQLKTSVDEHVLKCSESMQRNHKDELYEGLEKVFTISTRNSE